LAPDPANERTVGDGPGLPVNEHLRADPLRPHPEGAQILQRSLLKDLAAFTLACYFFTGGCSFLARGIELDWVIVSVQTIKKVIAVGVTLVLAAVLLVLVHRQLNPTPDVASRRAVRAAERAHERVRSLEIPDAWMGELKQASEQLEDARSAYTEERFELAKEEADSARSRFLALAGSGGYTMVGVGQIHSVAGRVSIQRGGRSGWDGARLRMPVFNGDFVKTGRDGLAEILFSDGTLFKIAPNSLLEIHHTNTARRDTSTVKMVVGEINVVTGRSTSVVSTHSVEAHIEHDSRVGLDVSDQAKDTTVSAYAGGATLRSSGGKERRVANRERIIASPEGSFSEVRRIPRPPRFVDPVNNRGFDLLNDPVITLKWSTVADSEGTCLQVSKTRSFVESDLDVNSPVIESNAARLQAILPGTYYWRLATVYDGGQRSEWGPIRRFRIYSPEQRRLIRDTVPPVLEVAEIRQLGEMFIVEGKTEPGSVVTINGDRVDTDHRGEFRRMVEVAGRGWTSIVIQATDPSGNDTIKRERVFLEEY